MQSTAKSPEEYIAQLPEDRKEVVQAIRKQILDNLPKGFEEVMQYGMLSYVVPHSIYPKGYHCTPELPLAFMSLASQKNSINLYSMAIYGSPQLLEWFTAEYSKHCKTKLDMGKSCIRFKKTNDIPYQLIGELSSKLTPEEWIKMYELNLTKR